MNKLNNSDQLTSEFPNDTTKLPSEKPVYPKLAPAAHIKKGGAADFDLSFMTNKPTEHDKINPNNMPRIINHYGSSQDIKKM